VSADLNLAAGFQSFRRPSIPKVTTFSYEVSGITAFALVTLLRRREMVMPIGRYIVWVGASLLAWLFVVDWYLPRSLPEPVSDAIDRPVIRIASVKHLPERIVIDTSQPTIVPPLTPVAETVPDEPSPMQSQVSAAPPPAMVMVDQKKPKATKRHETKIAHKPPLVITPAVADGSSATTAPLTKLSFMDFISRQLVRNPFNLN
jgi:hypothetical protein